MTGTNDPATSVERSPRLPMNDRSGYPDTLDLGATRAAFHHANQMAVKP